MRTLTRGVACWVSTCSLRTCVPGRAQGDDRTSGVTVRRGIKRVVGAVAVVPCRADNTFASAAGRFFERVVPSCALLWQHLTTETIVGLSTLAKGTRGALVPGRAALARLLADLILVLTRAGSLAAGCAVVTRLTHFWHVIYRVPRGRRDLITLAVPALIASQISSRSVVLAVGVSGAIDTAGKISASSCSAISSWGARDRVCCSQWTVVTGRALVTALRTFRCGVGLNGTAHTVVAWLAAVCVVLCHLKCSHSAVRARFTWWTLQREASADICVVALFGLATTLSE